MVPERTHSVSPRHDGYLHNRFLTKQPGRSFTQPVDAITFDLVDLSGEKPEQGREYAWLTAIAATMSEKEVARRAKKHRDSYPTVDDALADKIIMEAL
ncbi:MAG: hypothetical protein JXA18_10700 [Chitinispirillaceae bacterium]|nr:hypothetical protein [Chitinispirillaceae bacterium]